MTEPLETAELLAFTRTIEARSLSRAAAELRIPRATLSRRLQRIERRLGVRLIRRTTRTLALTDAGQALYEHARGILNAVRDAEASVRRTDPIVRGRLRVTTPIALPPSFHQMVCRFVERYPELRLELNASNRHVDLQNEGYDVAVRAGTEHAPGLMGRALARHRLIAVASPAYLDARGRPKTVSELVRHRCLLGYQRNDLPQTEWPLRKGGTVRVEGALHANDIFLLAQAAIKGQGIALLPSLLIEKALSKGVLEPVLERVLGNEARLMVLYQEREFISPAVRAFVDEIVRWASASLESSTFVEQCGEAVVQSQDKL